PWGVTDPLGRTYQCYFNPSALTTRVILPGKTSDTTFAKDTGPGPFSNLRPTQTSVYDATSVRTTNITYLQRDGMWLPATKEETGSGVSGAYRRTAYTYTSYPAQHILGL